MVHVTLKPRELDSKMTEEKRVKESAGGGTAPKPELQTVRFEWPGLPVGPGSEILYYKPNQRRPGELPQGVQPVPAVWVPSPHGAPWQYSGLTENNLAVKKFNYLAASYSNDTDDSPVSQHIHEHHHYGQRYPGIPYQPKPARYERHGYLVKVDNTGTLTAPSLPLPSHDTGMFRAHNNQRSMENGSYFRQYGSHYGCPYYAEYPNATYPQHQTVPYSEVNAIDQHYHVHQHYYHPQYPYQSAVKYQQSQFSHHPHQPRFLPHHQPRYHHAHHHTAQFPYHHTRPYYTYNEGLNWYNQGPLPRAPYIHNEYDLSALKEVLRTL